MIEKRGWSLLCEHKSSGYVALVREFYSNIVEKKEKTYYVMQVSFDKNEINKLLKMSDLKDGSKFKKLKKDPNY